MDALHKDTAVATYKRMLRDLINLRPSGTRQRIAKTLGTHKSFVSQVTNPSLRTPLPSQHVQGIFKACHFSAHEQAEFLRAYAHAHPDQIVLFSDIEKEDHDVIRIVVPPFKDLQKRREVEEAILEFSARLFALAKNSE